MIKQRNRADEQAIEAAWEAPLDPATEESYVADIPPRELFTAIVASEDDLRWAVEQVDWRWRTDLVTAIEEVSGA